MAGCVPAVIKSIQTIAAAPTTNHKLLIASMQVELVAGVM